MGKLTLAMKDVNAIENGMRKYNVDSKGLLEIVEGWEKDCDENQVLAIRHFKRCIKTYIEWSM